MEYAEIAKQLGISEDNAREAVSKGLRRIARAGDMQTFATVVRLTALERAKEAPIRCGSIECRPEKWVFYGAPTA